jgi:hypothetical protein
LAHTLSIYCNSRRDPDRRPSLCRNSGNGEIDSFCQGPGSDFDCISGFCFVTELSPQLSRCLYHPGIGNNDFFTVLMTQVLPIITPGLSVKSFVHEFQQYYDGQAPVYVEKFYRPGFMYNSGIAGIELSQENLAVVIASEKDTAYLVMKKKKYGQLPPAIQNKLRLLVVQEDKILLIHENK